MSNMNSPEVLRESVLLAEASPTMAMVVGRQILQLGYPVTTVETSDELLQTVNGALEESEAQEDSRFRYPVVIIGSRSADPSADFRPAAEYLGDPIILEQIRVRGGAVITYSEYLRTKGIRRIGKDMLSEVLPKLLFSTSVATDLD